MSFHLASVVLVAAAKGKKGDVFVQAWLKKKGMIEGKVELDGWKGCDVNKMMD